MAQLSTGEVAIACTVLTGVFATVAAVVARWPAPAPPAPGPDLTAIRAAVRAEIDAERREAP